MGLSLLKDGLQIQRERDRARERERLPAYRKSLGGESIRRLSVTASNERRGRRGRRDRATGTREGGTQREQGEGSRESRLEGEGK